MNEGAPATKPFLHWCVFITSSSQRLKSYKQLDYVVALENGINQEHKSHDAAVVSNSVYFGIDIKLHILHRGNYIIKLLQHYRA